MRCAIALAWVLVSCTPAMEDPLPEETPCVPAGPSSSAVHWRDAHGRAVLYHGVNLTGTAKSTADHLPPVTAEDFARLQAWGITAVRLLVFWQAVEPTPGEYDLTYLEGLRSIADLAGAAGIDVVLDPHQDVYGEGFGFAGFPAWTCAEELYAAFTRPSAWFLSYLEPEVMECFGRFWLSQELQDAYAAAMGKVVEVVGGSSAVVAFEMMNEPWPGNDPSSNFELHTLMPFYARVAEVVQVVNPNLRLLAEPAVLYNLGLGTQFEAPFGCPTYVFAPHFYPGHTERGDYNGDIQALREQLAPTREHANALGAPLAVTEFGTRAGPGSVAFLRDTFTILDELWASGFVWDYGPGQAFALIDPKGEPTPEAQAVPRPYAHRVAGEPQTQLWDEASGTFTVSFRESEPPVTAPTEIILPVRWFPGEVTVTSSDGSDWTYVREGTRLRVWSNPVQSEHEITVTAR